MEGGAAVKKQPRMCANGCPRPVAGDHVCICQECVDKITRNLEDALEYGRKQVRR